MFNFLSEAREPARVIDYIDICYCKAIKTLTMDPKIPATWRLVIYPLCMYFFKGIMMIIIAEEVEEQE